MTVLGCAWYPEQWPENQWSQDLRLMRQAGMTVVRIGEFAWSRLEPSDGRFELEWLERAVQLAADYDMDVVIGTPTAGPPAWLTQQHPDVLAINENGQRVTHGIRCHYSPTSRRYLDYCERIAGVMAERLGNHPRVIGWQIDNEYNWYGFSYDDETLRQFQEWLKSCFGTLENLNQRWSTVYWSQEYFDWSQIPFPIGNHNPGLVLAFRQFVTHVYQVFQHTQIEAIRRHAAPRQWITHNFMKWNESYDHYCLSEALDLVSWDNYVPTGHLDYVENGAMHDMVRGYKQKNFWLIETQPGQVNWSHVNTVLDRGEARAMAWHAIGHGADAILYWQWRSAPGGQEQMHGTLLAPDGKPRPIYGEIAQVGQDLQKARASLTGTRISAQIALLHTFEDRWAINYQRHHQDFDPVKHLLSYYRPLREMGNMLDIVHSSADLTTYKVVIAPNLNVLDEATARRLLDYAKAGGHLALGPRSGMKDSFNGLLPSRQPGPLAEALGAHVEEYYALEHAIPVNSPINSPVNGSAGGALGMGTSSIWAEQLQVDAADAEVLLTYGASNGWLDDQPAMVTRAVGKGRITYIGAWLDDTLMGKISGWLLSRMGATNRAEPSAGLPAGVECAVRESDGANGKRVIILINHTRQPITCLLAHVEGVLTKKFSTDWIDLLTGQRCESEISLAAYGVAVFEQH